LELEFAASAEADEEMAQKACFQLEFVSSLNGASTSAARHRVPLVPTEGLSEVTPTGASACVAVVGRHHQPNAFAAWLPNSGERKCVSRRAFDVLWVPGSTSGIWLRSRSTNHLLVDGVEVVQQALVQMRMGSEIAFMSEHRTLLHLRLVSIPSAMASPASPIWMPEPTIAATPERRRAGESLEVGAGGSPTTCSGASPFGFGGPSSPSSPSFQTTFSADFAFQRAVGHGASPHAGSLKAPMPQSLGDLGLEAAQQGGTASQVYLEICRSTEPRSRGQQRLGPLQLGAKPLLVGPRHQPDFFNGLGIVAAGASKPPHLFCLAFLGEEHWIFAVVPLKILRGDSSQVRLASDELAVIRAGDRILLPSELSADSSPSRASTAGGVSLQFLPA
jgi:hypothetical protein